MRMLWLPFFIVRLVLAQLPFLLSTVVALLYPVRSFIITLIFASCFLSLYYLVHQTTPVVIVRPAPSIKVLDTQLATWQSYAQQQPTHRDVLLNLALIYQARGDHDQARRYYLQARQLDPNHEVFARLNLN